MMSEIDQSIPEDKISVLMPQEYPPPVNKLLTYDNDDVRVLNPFLQIPLYRELGLREQHIPDLIRMATDEALLNLDVEGSSLASIHAWRALGQLGAKEAIIPLMNMLQSSPDGENDNSPLLAVFLPDVFANIGIIAMPFLREYLDLTKPYYATVREVAVESLTQIGKTYENADLICIEIFRQALENYEQHEPTVNAYLALGLLAFESLENVPLIEAAIKSGRIDPEIFLEVNPLLGDEMDEDEEEDFEDEENAGNIALFPPLTPDFAHFTARRTDKAKKNKRKQAAKSRKQNHKKR